MTDIVTVTLNPALDIACDAGAVVPLHKVRTRNTTLDPGGGGINVARVVTALGGSACAVILAGGPIGAQLTALAAAQIGVVRAIPIAGTTRISMTVHDQSKGQEYRFVADGPAVTLDEFAACRAALGREPAPWLVASGSLPPGLPPDSYAILARDAAARGQFFVLDTSGPALKAAIGSGLALIKPSLSEFEALVGQTLPDAASQDAAALAMVRDGAAARIAVSLGGDGALLATDAGVWRSAALPVKAVGAVGAGDSFVAAMALALMRGAAPAEALAWGMAGGAAAVSATGTAHPPRALVERLFTEAMVLVTQRRQ